MSKIEVNQISSQCGSTLTIGQSGDTVTLASGATQTGFGRTGTVDWCTTAKTAPFTGVSGKGYFVNTTCGAVTVTLPATPSAGDIISVKDYARTAGTNAINFCRNGSKMDGVCANSSISTSGESTTLIYVDGTKGWTSILDNTTAQYGAAYITATGGTITTCGDYKIHTFTSDSTFTVCSVGNPAGSNSVDYLVVAGGGGSGQDIGGGGGAGGFRYSSSTYCSPACAPGHPLRSPTGLPVSVTSYPITVGGGGTSAASIPVKGTDGSSSVFSTIISTGGGAGGSSSGPNGNGNSGGSGGGSGNDTCGARVAGSGNTPPTSPPQGNPGGGPISVVAGGGGGGAIAAGSPSLPGCSGGPGGAGAGLPIAFGNSGENCGSYYYFSGGGGGGARTPSFGPGGSGGIGGGGDGVQTGAGNGGTINTGGGAGGPSGNSVIQAPSGGSGIVIIRYKFQ
jgi:hypothetical protein